jgi:hypothetical protein
MRQITGTGQVEISGSPTLIVAGSIAATGVLVKNTDTSNAIYYGNADVTTGTGAFLGPLESITLPVQTAIWAVTLGPNVLVTWSMFQSSLPPTQSGGTGTGGGGGSSGTVDATIINTPYVQIVGTFNSTVTIGTPDVTVIGGTLDATVMGPPQMGNSPTAVFVGTASTLILSANPIRTGMTITNFSYETVFLAFGNPAVLNNGVPLGPGGSLTTDVLDNITEAINAIATDDMGGGYVSLQELT